MQLVPPGGAWAVDALGDAVVTLVRAYRHAGRRRSATALPALELVHLLGTDELRPGELAERRGVAQSVVSRQVAELEARGLACRRPDPADGRAGLVRLTPSGLRLLDDIGRVRRRWLREALARCPAQDVPAVTALVAALADELERHAGLLDPEPLHGRPA
jgi:DNA-binding MarR family transcriptional regulator